MVAIEFRAGDSPGARHMSGALVLDEQFSGGRLLVRYWSPHGQVWPEMHLERVRVRSDEPRDAFQLAVDGHDLRGGFRWAGADLGPDPSGYRGEGRPVTHGVVRLLHAERGIAVDVHTRLDGGPYLIRWLEITNRSGRPVGITAVSPLAGLVWAHRYDEHVPPGTETPFELGYNHRFDWGHEGDFWFEPLPEGVRSIDGGRLGRSGHGRPALWLRDRCNGQTFVCELAWGGNYELAVELRRDAVRKLAAVFFRAGLSGHDPVLRVLDAGETVVTPAVHAGLFAADLPAIVQATHEHVRRVVLPAQLPGREIEIEANHRGYLCDRETEPGLKADAEVAASIGTELYVIDAGWYGNDPNRWWLNVGDWRAGSWLPGGLEPVAAHARRLGMRFGVWVEIEAAGEASTLRKEHPDWLLRRNGEPVAGGRALDLTQPAVAAWVESEVARLIRQYELDMFRIDHNHLLAPSGNRVYQGRVEDLTWRYYEALYGILGRLRAAFPQVVFQNCAGGGGRLDWGTLRYFHNTELSDWGRLPRGLKILNNATLALPPEILLRTFGTETSELDLDGDLDTQLRLALLARPIFRGLAPSLPALAAPLRARIGHHLSLFREHIRPVLQEARVFHHTPALPLAEPAPWCVLEYADRAGRRGVAAVFRLTDIGPAEYVFRPRGLDAGQAFDVRLDNEGWTVRMTGRELLEGGVRVYLERPLSSQLLLFHAAG